MLQGDESLLHKTPNKKFRYTFIGMVHFKTIKDFGLSYLTSGAKAGRVFDLNTESHWYGEVIWVPNNEKKVLAKHFIEGVQK